MGNNLGGVSLLNYMHFPYHIQLGRYCAIGATEELDYWFDGIMRTVTVTYTVDGSTCELQLTTYPFNDPITIDLRDDIFSGPAIHILTTETHNSFGDVTKTNVIFHGNGNKGGLLVVEQKRKNGDMKPHKVTVAHHYAASSGNVFSLNKIDIGLSMVLNIRASNNVLDYTVEGPVQHPSSALFYMFEHVCETGIWKPLACPHCANLRQSSSKFWQSESEDSDSLPPARLRDPKQNVTSVVANDGAVRGNNNGNLSVGKLFFGGKHFK